jgi:chaperonin GroEL
MGNKQIYRFEDIKDRIIHAVDTISDPVRETISPKGRNVLFEDNQGRIFSTNDGATIVKNINVKDPVENAIIEIIKGSSLKTNTEVGDGTSTSVLLSQIMIKEGLKLVDGGINPMEIKREFNNFSEKMVGALKSQSIKVKNDKDLYHIAHISANNDDTIAKHVVEIVKTAGTDGMVFIENNSNPETEIIKDTGFIINQGLLVGELKNDPQKFTAQYKDIPVLITDKRLYYKAEADTIMSVALLAGHKSLVIVARDFLGEALNQLMANHLQGRISLLLVKDPGATDANRDSLHDLADYLGGKVIMEKAGDLVGKITARDFSMAGKAFADSVKTILTTTSPNNKDLKNKITAIRKELEKDKDNKEFKRRLASLTNGMVTVKVGGKTQIEVAENIYRFEDSINATRAAMKDGYLVGGGLAVYTAFQSIKSQLPIELIPTFKKFAEGNIRQIAHNCGKHAESIIENTKGNIGYNALKDKIEDLLKAGVIDPFKVTENAVNNSISITNQIISSNFLIVEEREEEKEV